MRARSSLDGTRKARLATHVVNGDGDTEKWLDVAQSDGGRIVAVRNKPGRISSFSWFKIWEPDGTSTVEGIARLPRAAGRRYELLHLSILDPIETTGQTHPALLGSRVISLDDSFHPAIVSVQELDAGNPYTNTFTQWLDTTDVGYDLNRVDVAANGQLMALVFEEWDGGTQTVGAILLRSIQGVDQDLPDPAAVDCVLPADGVARDASLSQDAGAVAWTDGGGLKVAGSPTTAGGGPCAMGSAPPVLSPTGEHPSIGGADVAAFLPTPPPAPPTPPPAAPGPGGAGAVAPVVTLPAKVTVKALARPRGVPVKVKVTGPGKISVRGTVPARRLGRRGKAVLVASGKGSASAAGTVTIRLRLTSAGRRRAGRLKGARLTLRIVHGSSSVKKVIRLR